MNPIQKVIEKAAWRIRRLCGADRILRKQYEHRDQLFLELTKQRHQLDRLTSYVEHSWAGEGGFEERTDFRRLRELTQLLSPMDISGAKYRRIGRDYDGGYVMVDDFPSSIEAAYSLGINDDVSWDEEIANRGIPIFMYDHTIDRLPKLNPLFKFFREGVSGSAAGAGFETLSNLIRRNGHQNAKNLILKMDIEGYEWSVLKDTPDELMEKFSQIVVELHDITPKGTDYEFQGILSVLKKINTTHQAVHVHANGNSQVYWFCGLALPSLLEVTFVRRSSYGSRLVPNTRAYPTEIDQPTAPWLPEIPLAIFSAKNLPSGIAGLAAAALKQGAS
jgi:hypothetical protein